MEARLLQPKTKQPPIFLNGENLLPAPKCLQPHFRVRDLHGLFYHMQAGTADTCSPWRQEVMK